MLSTSCLYYLKIHCILLFICFFPFPLVFAESFSFNIPHFEPGASNMLYEGDATPSNGSVELSINPTDASILFRVGRASFAEGVHLYDSSTGKLADFTTHFSFTITNDYDDASKISDGFVFFISPVDYPIPPNSAGGFFGLFNLTNLQRQIVLVEFDSFVNEDLGDPNDTHVGINSGSLSPARFADWDVSSTFNKVATVSITYNATTKNLSVSWAYENHPFLAGNSVSYIIDLKQALPEWVRIGFSATTGVYHQLNTIHSWEFTSNLDSRVGIPRTKLRTVPVLMICAAGFSILMLGGVISYCVIKRKNRNAYRSTFRNVDLEREALPRRFSYQQLVSATNNFADNMRLGQGGSGQVYKGVLNDLGHLVAVKRINAESMNSEKIFLTEVKIISRLIHRNLVQFIGWCHEQGRFLLVYEYMPNGSLDTHLFGDRRTLPWQVRYRIVAGLASAVHYLHEEVEQCVLHRDIKSANVLLGADFSTKLGDFGVAKLVDPRLRTQMTSVAGTLGYVAPEYARAGRATKESDMFSFGVVALEIACGRRTYLDGDIHIPLFRWVWQLYLAGNILNATDERLRMDFDKEEMERLLMVGLWCTHPKDKERPKAAQVIKVLRFEMPSPEFPNDMHDSVCSAPSSPSLPNESSCSPSPLA